MDPSKLAIARKRRSSNGEDIVPKKKTYRTRSTTSLPKPNIKDFAKSKKSKKPKEKVEKGRSSSKALSKKDMRRLKELSEKYNPLTLGLTPELLVNIASKEFLEEVLRLALEKYPDMDLSKEENFLDNDLRESPNSMREAKAQIPAKVVIQPEKPAQNPIKVNEQVKKESLSKNAAPTLTNLGPWLDDQLNALVKAREENSQCSFLQLCKQIKSSKSTVNRYRRLHLLRAMSPNTFSTTINATKFSRISDITKTDENTKALDKVITDSWNEKAKGYSDFIKVFGRDWILSTFGDKVKMAK